MDEKELDNSLKSAFSTSQQKDVGIQYYVRVLEGHVKTMNKEIEQLKKQITEITDVLNKE